MCASVGAKKVRSRNWFITLNNYTEAEIDLLKGLPSKWTVIAEETAPTTGTKHIHCVISFENARYFSSLKKMLPRADLEKVKSTCSKAREYATKDGNIIYESGEPPKDPGSIQDVFKEMVQQAKDGTIDEESLMFCRFERFFRRFYPKLDQIFNGDLETKNAWIYGPTGTGKSRLVRNYANQRGFRIYNKLANKWWDNYHSEQIVLIEDLDPESCKYLANHIKLWADRYAFSAEFKGGICELSPIKFQLIVTSNYSIEECFKTSDVNAISRRFQEIYFG